MKLDYVERATEFIYDFIDFINGKTERLYDCLLLCDDIKRYNKTLGIKATYDSGLTRHVILNEDYVIKWDKNSERISMLGGCENEIVKYEQAERDRMAYLLAPITRIDIHGFKFYVMPRVEFLGEADIEEYLTRKEIEWVYNNLDDIHSENWGWYNGEEVMIFDYAFPT